MTFLGLSQTFGSVVFSGLFGFAIVVFSEPSELGISQILSFGFTLVVILVLNPI